MMNPIYHILGAPITHHNHTVLRFFQQDLLPRLAGQSHIFYVVSDENLATQYPTLNIHTFALKNTVAKAVVAQAKRQPNAQFVLHGQFNLLLWWAILCGKLPATRCYWHVWGADLYEASTAWQFKLIYPLRRLAQNKLPELWATQGDLDFAKTHLRRDTQRDRLLYFPTKMMATAVLPKPAPTSGGEKCLTLLVGNSGDSANRHIEAFAHIKQRLNEAVRLLVPMGYPANNEAYIAQVRQQAVEFFPKIAKNVEILTENLDFERYLALLTECDAGYFHFVRQQGIGTICLLTQLAIPTVLRRENPFTLDMAQAGVPFVFADELSAEKIAQARQQLRQLDKSRIPFFAPNYTEQWLTLLTEVSEKQHDD